MIAGLPNELNNPFFWGLACATLQPGLRSVLVYNCPPAFLQSVSVQLKKMLQMVDGREVLTIHLGSDETEDDLWGTLSPYRHGKTNSFAWRLGRLASSPKDRRIHLVVIPNLNLLSLPAARACVTLMEADIAYLERHGQDTAWIPNYFWLASCSASDLNQVSPHLLDRFALRLQQPKMISFDRVTDILASAESFESARKNNIIKKGINWFRKAISFVAGYKDHEVELNADLAAIHHGNIVISSNVLKLLRKVVNRHPTLDEGVVPYILQYFSQFSQLGMRREIALARLARAHAQLVKSERVTTAHIDTVVELIGLKQDISARTLRRLALSAKADKTDVREDASSPSRPTLQRSDVTAPNNTAVHSPDTQETLSPASLSGPYFEDTLPKDREMASLQLKQVGYRATIVRNGSIIGTERADDLRDLALVSTLLEAAKFQVIRHKLTFQRTNDLLQSLMKHSNMSDASTLNKFRQDQFLISASDLRSYRRAPVPKRMLILVLDYTCLHDCLWIEAILPHLEWAYTERASACLIQVGAATTTEKDALRAREIISSSILAPRFRNAFGVAPGQATPLAHGLEMAKRTIMKALQSDRSRVQSVRLVILSDGRGNVPLKASKSGIIEWPVNREGIEDALEVARGIHNLRNIETFLLNPQPQQYPNLPIALAEAMGAFLDLIPLKNEGGSQNG